METRSNIKINCYPKSTLRETSIVIFGASGLGQNLYKLLVREGLTPFYFTDNKSSLWHEQINGLPIFPPAQAIELSQSNDKSLILVASSYYSEIRMQLILSGLTEGVDFVNSISFRIEESFQKTSASIRELKKLHKGKRGFLIGNGPSLDPRDLDVLRNEITFAANKIYLAYENTNWRPNYYFVCDPLVAHHNKEKISSLETQKFLANSTCFYGEEINTGFVLPYFYRNTTEALKSPHFSLDLTCGFFDGGSVVYMMMQAALYMGFQELYLIGMDHSFRIEDNDKKILTGKGEINHFHKDYRPAGETWSRPDFEYMNEAFEYAKQVLECYGCKVFNASRKSALETFEKVEFDSLLKG